MGPQFLPAAVGEDSAGWRQTVLAFLAEKHRRSGSQRTVVVGPRQDLLAALSFLDAVDIKVPWS